MSTFRDQVKTIFGRALEISDRAERARFVDRACAADQTLKAEVEALLAASADAGSLLNAPVAGFAPTITEPAAAAPNTIQIGPYKLLQAIGEGGMGTVYAAEQTHPVQRKVALKIIKAGMDSRQVIARFEAERQALALMDHPNIAKVLDAGTTDSGRPYFVMELVNGIPITKYCDEHHLSPRERLELFVPVCQAVQHAHQKGVIHRDLKPSNVLIARYDGRPMPKVIDFGVAKAAGLKLTEQTLFTEVGQVVGTLEYMSPEQAELNQLDIDTRSDIYSLGVLLYELLTGTTPFEKKRLKNEAFMEMLRIIREDEPQKPSTRLSTTDELPSIAANRGLEPKKLSGQVRGELDWIVMKALEKDRSRRYETANGFAMDILRYLADEPVMACPPSMVYRLRKFARRNKAAISTLAVISLALIASTAVSTWQAVRAYRAEGVARTALDKEREALAVANTQRSLAIQERDRSVKAGKLAVANLQKARDAVDRLLTRVSEEELLNTPQMEDLRRRLLEDALHFHLQFLESNSGDATLQRDTACTEARVGHIHGVLGHYEESERHFEQAFRALDNYLKENPDDFEVGWQCISYRTQHAWALSDNANRAGSYRQIEQAVALMEQLAKRDPQAAIRTRYIMGTYDQWGEALRKQKRFDEAEAALLKANAMAREHKLDDLLAWNLQKRGELALERGWAESCEELLKESLAQFERLHERNADVPAYLGGMANTNRLLGNFYLQRGRFPESEQARSASAAAFAELFRQFPRIVAYQNLWANQLLALGELQAATGKVEAAECSLATAVSEMRSLTTSLSPPWYLRNLTRCEVRLFTLLRSQGKNEEAKQDLLDWSNVLDELFGRTDLEESRELGLSHAYHGLAECYLQVGNEVQAERARVKRDLFCRRIVRQESPDSQFCNLLAWLLATCPDVSLRDSTLAVELAAKATQQAPQTRAFRNTLGVACYRAGQWRDAVNHLEQSMASSNGGDAFDWLFLAMTQWQLNDKDDARKWFDKAIDWIDANAKEKENDELRRFRTEAASLLGITISIDEPVSAVRPDNSK